MTPRCRAQRTGGYLHRDPPRLRPPPWSPPGAAEEPGWGGGAPHRPAFTQTPCRRRSHFPAHPPIWVWDKATPRRQSRVPPAQRGEAPTWSPSKGAQNPARRRRRAGSCPCAAAVRAPQTPLRPESFRHLSHISRSASNAVRSPLNQPSSAASGRGEQELGACSSASFQKAPSVTRGGRRQLAGTRSGGAAVSQARAKAPDVGSAGERGDGGELPRLPLRSDPENSPGSFGKGHRPLVEGCEGNRPRPQPAPGRSVPWGGGGPGDLLRHQEMLQRPGPRAKQMWADHRFRRALAVPTSLSAFHNTASNQPPSMPPPNPSHPQHMLC